MAPSQPVIVAALLRQLADGHRRQPNLAATGGCPDSRHAATGSRQTRQIFGTPDLHGDLARSNVVPPPVAISGPTNPAPKIFLSRPVAVSCRRFGRAKLDRTIETGLPTVGARCDQRTRSFENDCRVARPLGFSKLRIPSPAPYLDDSGF